MYKDIQSIVETALSLGGRTLQESYDYYDCSRHEWIETLRGRRLDDKRIALRSRLLKDARENAAFLSSVLKRAK
jgi:hypothetical protein